MTTNSLMFITLSSVLLTACVSGGSPDLLPDTGPTTLEVYNGSRTSAPDKPFSPYHKEAQSLNRGQQQEPYANQAFHDAFKTLANPTLYGFVYPHMNEAGYPVSGYFTQFKLWNKDQFALPGEAAPSKRTRQ